MCAKILLEKFVSPVDDLNGPSMVAEVEYDGHGAGRKLCGRL